MSGIYHFDTVKSQSVQIKKLFMSFYYECLAIKKVSGFTVLIKHNLHGVVGF